MIARDPGSGPPRPDFTPAWRARLATVLAEAAAQGLADDTLADECGRITSGFTTRTDAP
ncbi:hypothetical protein [Tsukamurella soli]|uniref:hypothetical protein n=1 Tax=Tsukamurella soli TaxID=644556 RepID=UPI003612CB34